MNREIKFRGQRLDKSELVYGDLIHGVGAKSGRLYILPNKINLAYVKDCHPLDGVEVIAETVGQLTGLKDKNGKEIYEGDIITDHNGDRRAIDFKDGSFMCTYPSGGRFLPAEEWREIIGNVHEHPELTNPSKPPTHEQRD